MQEKPGKNPVWSFFSSVRLTLALLIIIALAAVIGTVVPQQGPAPDAARSAPALAPLLNALQIHDLYHSVWFLLLLGLLTVNLIVCSVNRFPVSLRCYRSKPAADRRTLYDNLPPGRVVAVEDEPVKVSETLQTRMTKAFGRTERNETETGTYLRSERGAWSYFGVYVVHAGVLVLIAGVVAGSLLGFDGMMNIPEGQSLSRVELKGGKGDLDLGFDVKCEAFQAEFYDSGMPKLYRSELSFLRKGNILARGSLMVNHPLEFEGIHFYQATYGALPGEAVIRIAKPGEQAVRKVREGDRFTIDNGKAQVEVQRVEGNLMRMGPAVKIGITAGDRTVSFWVFRFIDQIEEHNPGITTQVPQFNAGLYKPYRFHLENIETLVYTGLKVTRDPGVPVVGAGAFLMVAGFILTFFSSHRQVFVRIDRHGGKTRVAFADRSSRDAAKHERAVDKFIRAYKGNA